MGPGLFSITNSIDVCYSCLIVVSSCSFVLALKLVDLIEYVIEFVNSVCYFLPAPTRLIVTLYASLSLGLPVMNSYLETSPKEDETSDSRKAIPIIIFVSHYSRVG